MLRRTLPLCSILSAVLLSAGCSGSNQNHDASPVNSEKGTAQNIESSDGKFMGLVRVLGRWEKASIEVKDNQVFYNGRRMPKSNVILLPSTSEEEQVLLGLVGYSTNGQFNTSYLWPDGKIPYEIPANLDAPARKALEAAIATMNEKTVVKFVPKRQEDTHFVTAEVVESTCGTACAWWGRSTEVFEDGWNPNTIEFLKAGLNDSRLYGLTLHELAHTVGMGHEFNRSDVNQYLQFHQDNYNPNKGDYSKYFPCFAGMSDCSKSFQQGVFDVDSVTLYAPYIFGLALDKSKPLISRKTKVGNQDILRQDFSGNVKLSERDIRAIAYLYQSSGAPLISKIDASKPDAQDELPDLEVQPNSLVSIDFKTKNIADCTTHIKGSILGTSIKVDIKSINGLDKTKCNLSFLAPSNAGYYTVLLPAASEIESQDKQVCVSSRNRRGLWVQSCSTQKETVQKGKITQEEFRFTVGTPQQQPYIQGEKEISFEHGLAAGELVYLPIIHDNDPGDRAELVVTGGADRSKFVPINGALYSTENLTAQKYEVTVEARDIRFNKSAQQSYTFINAKTGFCSQEKSDEIHNAVENKRVEVLNSQTCVNITASRKNISDRYESESLNEINAKSKELENLSLQSDILKNTKILPHPCTSDSNARYWVTLVNKYSKPSNGWAGCESARGLTKERVDELIRKIDPYFNSEKKIYQESIKITQGWMANNPNPRYLTSTLLQSWIDSYTAAMNQLDIDRDAALKEANEKLPALPQYFAGKFPAWDEANNNQNAEAQALLDSVKLTLPEIEAKIKAARDEFNKLRTTWYTNSQTRTSNDSQYIELGAQYEANCTTESVKLSEQLKQSEMAKVPCLRLKEKSVPRSSRGGRITF